MPTARKAVTTCHDCPYRPDRPRSLPQHNRFFKLVDALYLHYPEDHWFRPRNRDHLRYWLTMLAGECDVVATVRMTGRRADSKQFCRVLREIVGRFKTLDHVFIEADADCVVVKETRSLRFPPQRGAMSQARFNALCGRVEEIIAAEYGLAADDLLSWTERAA
ncbi:MAG TPA: hypothetical protein VNK52_16260 [Hyphomicrobiaceae bacterium]|nr:hypothetical protein [Hyphomicrobiaceae bacterium]